MGDVQVRSYRGLGACRCGGTCGHHAHRSLFRRQACCYFYGRGDKVLLPLSALHYTLSTVLSKRTPPLLHHCCCESGFGTVTGLGQCALKSEEATITPLINYLEENAKSYTVSAIVV